MIYFDNASTTSINSLVLEEINRTNKELYYNPSALYKYASKTSALIDDCRNKILTLLGASSFDNLIFTSGATESNNLAIRGALKRNGKLLISKGEHPSVYNLAKQLKTEGYEVDFIELTKEGVINESDLMSKLSGTTVVSMIHVSNETGAVNPIEHLTKLIKDFDNKIIVHTDGVQAIGKINLNMQNLGVDLYTLSSHKINGPKGMGGLFVKKGINIKPLLYGGDQEKGLRAGTENVSGITAFAKAVEISFNDITKKHRYVQGLKDYLAQKIVSEFSGSSMLSIANSSPYIALLSFPKLKSETLVHLLETNDILIGSGSACSSKYSDNRILSAMGFSKEYIDGSVRLSFSDTNTKEEIDIFIKTLKQVTDNYYSTIKF